MMMQPNKNAMLEALRNKKGEGVDITIMLGGGDDDEGDDDADSEDTDTKELGLAPEGTPLGDEEETGQPTTNIGAQTPGEEGMPSQSELEGKLMQLGLGKNSLMGKKQLGMMSK